MILSNFKSRHPAYKYCVDATEPLETKLQVFKEYLVESKECILGVTPIVPGGVWNGIYCIATSPRTKTARIYIGLNPDKEKNREECITFDQAYAELRHQVLVGL